jgi:esterase/lipase superfamily enzyme
MHSSLGVGLSALLLSLSVSLANEGLAQSTKNRSIESGLDSEIPRVTQSARRRYIRVLFSTNREINLQEETKARLEGRLLSYEDLFLNAPAVGISYGWAEVSYPSNRKKADDSHGLNSLLQNPNYQFSVADHFIVSTPRAFSRLLDEFFQGNDHPALLYVHGLDNSWNDAAQRLAQMAIDLVQPGVPLFFSWPSDVVRAHRHVPFIGISSTSYQSVQKISADSRPYLAHTMDELVEGTRRTFGIVAHSMGADLASTSISLMRSARGASLGAPKILVLAAPDMSGKEFAAMRPVLTHSDRRVLVYCSYDRTLLASQYANNSDERLGYCASTPKAIPDVDLVMVRGAISDFGRHAYYLSAAKIIDDVERSFLAQYRYGRGADVKPGGRVREIKLP